MSALSDAALRRMREAMDHPDLTGSRYTLEDRIGEGGMGVVYRVFDRDLGRHVALKVIRTPLAESAANARIRREARTLAHLEHPGIVPVHDAGVLPDGRPYYVMKLVRGERLDAYAATQPAATVLNAFERLCETVAFAHTRGVIHRDLKPDNVMVGGFGEVLLLDWGVARVDDSAEPTSASVDEDRERTLSGTVIGTPGWMAPEQAAGQPIDARADVYSLGMILRALTENRSRDRLDALSLPAAPLRAIVAKATTADPEGRYASALALGDDLRALRDRLPVSAYRERVWERVARVAVKYRTPIGLVLAYILMRALLLAFTGR